MHVIEHVSRHRGRASVEHVARMEKIRELSCADFCDFLLKEGFHEDIVSTFTKNRICGETFFEMTEEDIKELVPIVGDRIRVRKLLNVVRQDQVRTRLMIGQ